jgi:hypothetical protein
MLESSYFSPYIVRWIGLKISITFVLLKLITHTITIAIISIYEPNKEKHFYQAQYIQSLDLILGFVDVFSANPAIRGLAISPRKLLAIRS